MNDHGLTRENLVATLPPALQKDPSAVALAETIAEALARRRSEIQRLRIYPVIDRLDERLLDMLAYDFKVDWWNADYSLEEKRRTLKDSWFVHKRLGTRAAVETAIQAIYPEARVDEWFAYGGRPYHFRLFIDLSRIIGEEQKVLEVMGRVNYYKSLRSHLDDIQYTIEAQEPAMLHVGGPAASVVRVQPAEKADELNARDRLYLGGQVSVLDMLPPRRNEDMQSVRAPLYAGGAAGALEVLNVREDCTPKAGAPAVLRTGGVCTIIANPVPPLGEP